MPIPPQATTDAVSLADEAASQSIRALTLVHAPPPMRVPQRILLGPDLVIFGREPPSAHGFLLEDVKASRQHARICYLPDIGGYRIEDLQSRNGTMVNGRRIISEVLTPHAVLRIGGCLFVYTDIAVPHGTQLPEMDQ